MLCVWSAAITVTNLGYALQYSSPRNLLIAATVHSLVCVRVELHDCMQGGVAQGKRSQEEANQRRCEAWRGLPCPCRCCRWHLEAKGLTCTPFLYSLSQSVATIRIHIHIATLTFPFPQPFPCPFPFCIFHIAKQTQTQLDK